MLRFEATPPPIHIVRFFESLLPGFWRIWIGAADSALREIQANLGGDTIITSWFRSVGENRAVGGDPDSQHLIGLALDVVPGKKGVQLGIDEAAGSFVDAGFVVVPASTHLHVQTFQAGVLRRAGVLDALSV